jgi:hypothetical protein
LKGGKLGRTSQLAEEIEAVNLKCEMRAGNAIYCRRIGLIESRILYEYLE